MKAQASKQINQTFVNTKRSSIVLTMSKAMAAAVMLSFFACTQQGAAISGEVHADGSVDGEFLDGAVQNMNSEMRSKHGADQDSALDAGTMAIVDALHALDAKNSAIIDALHAVAAQNEKTSKDIIA